MQRNELEDIALSELRHHGVKGQSRHLPGGHLEVAWQVVPEKEIRRVIIAKTTSDWRSRMNTRAEVRKLLRADNIALRLQNEKQPRKQPALVKALELPKPDVVPIPDQITALRSELGDLTELVMRLTRIATSVRDTLGTLTPPPAPVPVAAPEPPSSRSVKIVEYLSRDQWVSLAALARDTGLSKAQIKLKLGYLERKGEIECFRGEARLKAKRGRPPKAKAKARLNGHARMQ